MDIINTEASVATAIESKLVTSNTFTPKHIWCTADTKRFSIHVQLLGIKHIYKVDALQKYQRGLLFLLNNYYAIFINYW